jgi:hypothetical protein
MEQLKKYLEGDFLTQQRKDGAIALIIITAVMLSCTFVVSREIRASVGGLKSVAEKNLAEQKLIRSTLGDFQQETLVLRLQSLEDRLVIIQKDQEENRKTVMDLNTQVKVRRAR